MSLDHERGEPERDLVEQEQARRGHQRPADRDHLLLAAREPARLLLDALLQAREEVEDLCDRVVDARPAARRGADPEVLLDGELLEHVPALRHLARRRRATIASGRMPLQARAAEPDLAVADRTVVDVEQARDRPDRRRLAGAVRAEQRDRAVLGHGEGDAPQRERDAVDDLEVVDGEERAAAGAIPSAGAAPVEVVLMSCTASGRRSVFRRAQMPARPVGWYTITTRISEAEDGERQLGLPLV